ncbi:MAG: hypothetical protein ABI473_10950 [Candidatus Dormibacter sp.]
MSFCRSGIRRPRRLTERVDSVRRLAWVVEAADQRCPYSNAVRGNVPVTITVD